LHPSWVKKINATNPRNRHKTHGKQPEQITCPQGIAFFMIKRSDHEKSTKNNSVPSEPNLILMKLLLIAGARPNFMKIAPQSFSPI